MPSYGGMDCVAILVGPRSAGSNMASLLDAINRGEIQATPIVVAPHIAAPALRRVAPEIPTFVLNPQSTSYSADLKKLLANYKVKWICLAGYLSLLPSEIVRAYERRILNIHPALLPKFGGKGMYGSRVHEAVLKAKESESGCTVHFVDEQYDEGEIILQERCPVLQTDTAESLAERVLALELQTYPKALKRAMQDG